MEPAALKPLRFLAVCIAAALLLAGCGAVRPKDGASTPPPGQATAEAARAWPFAPSRLRVHRLTRWSRDEGGRGTLEVHFELFDRWGHGVKGLGTARFELAPAVESSSRQTVRWELDLTNPETVSRGHYDYVTRTFIMTLLVDTEADWGRRSIVRVQLTTIDGRTLTSELSLDPL